MGDNGRSLEAVAELNHDRRSSPAARIVECARLFLDDAAQLVYLEVRLVPGCGEHPTDRTGHCSDARPAAGELPPGITQPFEKVLAAGRLLLGQLGERLDRAAGHPAGTVRPIVTEFLNSFGEDGVHRWGNCRLDRMTPEISVVVTLYNEDGTAQEVVQRTVAALDALGRPWEVILVDDGSTDGTWTAVEGAHTTDERVRGVRLKRNFGQHPAMHAGLVRARGDVLVTMDGDLQNSPEDIPKLVAALDEGIDVASGRRNARRDSWGRTVPSLLVNGMLRRFTGVDISDYGCAFNAYRRSALEPALGAIGKQKFTKALVLSTGASVVEVDVQHSPRSGTSRYSPLRLTRVALNVLAGFWPQPIQWIGLALGTLCTLAAVILGIYGVVFWIAESNFPGPLFGGVGIIFVLGVQGFILALIGEYLGRIQRDVEGRPLYTVDREL
jgi:undecaprenyl-phosphate 4-deoxy-4-formamido-L-arabinose transferase